VQDQLLKALNWDDLYQSLHFSTLEKNQLAEALYNTKVAAYEEALFQEAHRYLPSITKDQVHLTNQYTKGVLKKQANLHASYILKTHNADLKKYLNIIKQDKYPLRNSLQIAQEVDKWTQARFKKRAQLIARTESFTPITKAQTDFYRQNKISNTKFYFKSDKASCKVCKVLVKNNPHSLNKVLRVGIPHPNCPHQWVAHVEKKVELNPANVWLGGANLR